jgi:3D-(3,5/4)-trihydroxycyclohexane-1,2-dione acylhydrolase (decyclizing)
VGPLGVAGAAEVNRLVGEADLILALGTRLQDFTTASWTLFDADAQLVSVNTASFDARKHRAVSVVGDVQAVLEELAPRLAGWVAPDAWARRAAEAAAAWNAGVERRTSSASDQGRLSYAQVIGVLQEVTTADDYLVTASGGFPSELNANWWSRARGSVDIEYGFSCMGYEIAGGWGAAMARAGGKGDVFVLVGDGAYLMMNVDLFSSVRSGHKMIVVLCDNGGYAVIDRLQTAKGGNRFGNLLGTGGGPHPGATVDFAAHARSLGCAVHEPMTREALARAVAAARSAPQTAVIVVRTDGETWTDSDAFWEVGLPQQSDLPSIRQAQRADAVAKRGQRVGW